LQRSFGVASNVAALSPELRPNLRATPRSLAIAGRRHRDRDLLVASRGGPWAVVVRLGHQGNRGLVVDDLNPAMLKP